VGALARDRRDDLLRIADALIVPSIELASGRSEGMPVVVLEAMAAGVPVVATATGGLATLPPDAAHLVPPADPRALAAAIDTALAAPRRPGPVHRFIDAFDWSRVGAALDAHWGR
jgi:glycosyltransferase involved in cell wall biosynthesis